MPVNPLAAAYLRWQRCLHLNIRPHSPYYEQWRSMCEEFRLFYKELLTWETR